MSARALARCSARKNQLPPYFFLQRYIQSRHEVEAATPHAPVPGIAFLELGNPINTSSTPFGLVYWAALGRSRELTACQRILALVPFRSVGCGERMVRLRGRVAFCSLFWRARILFSGVMRAWEPDIWFGK